MACELLPFSSLAQSNTSNRAGLGVCSVSVTHLDIDRLLSSLVVVVAISGLGISSLPICAFAAHVYRHLQHRASLSRVQSSSITFISPSSNPSIFQSHFLYSLSTRHSAPLARGIGSRDQCAGILKTLPAPADCVFTCIADHLHH